MSKDITRGTRYATITSGFSESAVLLSALLAGTDMANARLYDQMAIENLGESVVSIAVLRLGLTNTPTAADYVEIGIGEQETFATIVLERTYIKVADDTADNKLRLKGMPGELYA